jgi:hypothetical protein
MSSCDKCAAQWTAANSTFQIRCYGIGTDDGHFQMGCLDTAEHTFHDEFYMSDVSIIHKCASAAGERHSAAYTPCIAARQPTRDYFTEQRYGIAVWREPGQMGADRSLLTCFMILTISACVRRSLCRLGPVRHGCKRGPMLRVRPWPSASVKIDSSPPVM